MRFLLVFLFALGASARADDFEGRVCRITDAGTGGFLGQFVLTEAGDDVLFEGRRLLHEARECWERGEPLSPARDDLRIVRYSGLFGTADGPRDVSALTLGGVALSGGTRLGLVVEYRDRTVSLGGKRIDLSLRLEGAGCERILGLGRGTLSPQALLLESLTGIAIANGILSTR